MKVVTLFSVALGASVVLGLQNPHRKAPVKPRRSFEAPRLSARSASNSTPYLTNKTKEFEVDGSKLPQVPFDIGESYAGTLPISDNSTDENRLFFWFFPSENPKASDEITIWLNGGPGCSSLDGLFQENGPFLWQSGTYSPVQNPYSWTNLTNMVYVDQPIGTGFSPAAKGAPAKIINEEIVAKDFMAFWKNFMETFDLTGRKVYITGESYAGQYIPYISYFMLEANNTEYYDVKGIQINDPSINEDNVLTYAPSVWHLNDYSNIFGLNETFMKEINERAKKCGYFKWMETALTFPPKGPLPAAPNASAPGCAVWDDIVTAEIYVNPCFNVYHLTDYCPFLWDELGFPSLGWGPNNYFNQSDVQKAINAPPTNYAICGDDNLGLNVGPGDRSVPSALGPLPHVIEKTNNVLLGHGWLDYLLLANGSLATIQNMTWNGKQGFQKRPSDPFYVPYPSNDAIVINEILNQPIPPTPLYTNLAGAGILGTTHTERGLTFCTVNGAGHEIPQYAPGAAFRQLEFLLGRIPSLSTVGPYTTQQGHGGNKTAS
ncbi:hypothetical protein AC579_7413 [Pseudocercospora musae]|uniref:Carboxypeptidase n=1 Tax=Pseudocercospora musae TaxID=113226 RepID=A0A139IQP5_9PEZI|nr:hypothetical protein AC579_7413 [Pseudocercospora musae]